MKNAYFYFILTFLLNLAFAKNTVAAVPSQKSLPDIHISKDSIIEYDYDYFINQQKANKDINQHFKNARILANCAYICFVLFLLGVFLAFSEFFLGPFILIFGSIILGFILSIVSLVNLMNVKRLIKSFPELAEEDSFKNRWTNGLIRSIIAFILYFGIVFLTVFEGFSDSPFRNSRNVPILGALGAGLFFLFDSIFFKTKKSVKQ